MPRTSRSSTVLKKCSVSELLLDPKNPRFPEGMPRAKGIVAAQPEILEHLCRTGVLSELASSFLDNGYFATEPLIATADGAPAGKFIVLEGNRRLATLQILLGDDQELRRFLPAEAAAIDQNRLDPVPVLIVEHRSDATAMIGFRHIGGLKFWDADAKARWICIHVDQATASNGTDQFDHISRQVGLPTVSVRNAYIAWITVAVARSEFGYDPVPLIVQDRFGVWLRAVESPLIRGYIGIGNARHYDAVRKATQKLSERETLEVLADLVDPPEGTGVVGDSRNISRYANVISNQKARKVLRKTRDLAQAQEELAPLTVLQYIHRATQAARRLRDELDRPGEIEPEAVDAIKELQKITRNLLSGR